MRTFGVERERFITNSLQQIIPGIGILLPKVWEDSKTYGLPTTLFTYELFAGQIEDRTPTCKNYEELKRALAINDHVLSKSASELGFLFDYSEIIDPKRITSLEVNPFDERHHEIWMSIPSERKIAASIVAAVHIHISVSEDEAVELLNLCREDVVTKLIDLGDHSNRQRIDAYRTMAGTDGIPPTFATFVELIDYINVKNGEKNVWDLVRYKPSTKTVEFRMFGATASVDEVLRYVKACHELIPK